MEKKIRIKVLQISFKKFQKLRIFNNTTNSIENTAIQINKYFKYKNKKFIDNKKFKNLDFMKYLIDKKKLTKLFNDYNYRTKQFYWKKFYKFFK